MGAFGVDLPENFDEPDSGADKSVEENTGTEISEKKVSTEESKPETPTVQEMVDLDKLEKFRWQGRDWSLKELQDGVLMRQDYSKKTAEISEARKYADNFDIDLNAVLKNPDMWSKFKEIYPPTWTSMAERILEKTYGTQNAANTGVAQSQSNNQTDVMKQVQHLLGKEVGPLKEKLQEYETQKYEAEVQKNEALVDQIYTNLAKKYPSALEDVVTAKALAVKDQGIKLNESVFEKLFKESHDMMEKRWTERTKQQVIKQQEANLKAKDMGAGGSVPSGSNSKMNLKQAREAMLASLEG